METNIYTKPQDYKPILQKQNNEDMIERKLCASEIYNQLNLTEVCLYGLILVPFLTMAIGKASLMLGGVMCLLVGLYSAFRLKRLLFLKAQYEIKYGFKKEAIRWDFKSPFENK